MTDARKTPAATAIPQGNHHSQPLHNLMRARPLLFLLLLTVAIVAAWWQLNRPPPAAPPAAAPLLAGLDIGAVTRIAVEGPDGPLATVEKSGTGWCVAQRDGYPANPQAVTALLLGLAQIKPLQSVAAPPAQFGRLALAAPGTGAPPAGTGTLLRLSAGPVEWSLLLGKAVAADAEAATAEWQPRYARVPGASAAVVANAAPDPRRLTPESWLDPEFPRLSTLTACELRKSGKLVWRLSRADDGQSWRLADAAAGETVAPEAAVAIERAWATLRFQDVGRPTPDARPPLFQLRGTGGDGLSITLELTPAPGGGWLTAATVAPAEGVATDPARQERAAADTAKLRGWRHLVPQDALAPMLVPRASLLAARPTP